MPAPGPIPLIFTRQLWALVGQNVESDFCFPSGHTNAAFAAMVPVFILGKKRWSWLALLFGVLMGDLPIYLVVHYPTRRGRRHDHRHHRRNARHLVSLYLPRVWYRWDLLKKKAEEA